MMTSARCRNLLVACAIALCFALLAARAGAQNWPTARRHDVARLRVLVPAGALPPGPATAHVDHDSSADILHSVRFSVASEGPTEVELPGWSSTRGGAPRLTVLFDSETGAHWSTTVEPDWGGDRASSASVFVGSAERMAEFSSQWRTASGLQTPFGTIPQEMERLPSGLDVDGHCLDLMAPRVVVVDTPDAERLAAWRACAAKGAQVLIVANDHAERLHRLEVGPIYLLGAGRITRVPWRPPAPERTLVAPHAAFDTGPVGLHSGSHPSSRDRSADPPKAILLALLALFVAAAGPIRYWVATRSRRPGLVLAWLPASALVACAALFLATYSWRAGTARLHLQRVLLTSPEGAGLAASDVWIEGLRPELYELRFPWSKQGQLTNAYKPGRFGHPFLTPSKSIHVEDDRIASTMTVTGLQTGRLREESLRWVEPVQVRAPRLLLAHGRLEVFNDTTRTIRRAVVVTDAARFELGELQPGQRKTAEQTDPLLGPAAYETSLDTIVAKSTGDKLMTRDNYLLAVEYAEPTTEITTTPHSEASVRETHVVVGTIPNSEEAP